ncbi:ankyrin repeat domain-containing protein 53 [Alligator mississippiensis]|uniref:Ankyrin repeat domain-containing protein 53 n=1 Tax=Alligator mississippiensis TaxID=8496 RepID=A0A151MCF4_ALLMI|nr:ankyrin repeat domain-containing protein 53 [Alligator mississippiensis]
MERTSLPCRALLPKRRARDPRLSHAAAPCRCNALSALLRLHPPPAIVQWLGSCSEAKDGSKMRAGFSVIHSAALNGRLDCLKTIVEKYEVDVNLPSLKGWRPIHLVMNKESGPRALECLQYLIGKGADVNVQNQTGASPLHKAASEGRLPCIIALVEAGADIFAKDAEGHVPVDLCKLWAHRSCAR